jgi:hypothetical protein
MRKGKLKIRETQNNQRYATIINGETKGQNNIFNLKKLTTSTPIIQRTEPKSIDKTKQAR